MTGNRLDEADRRIRDYKCEVFGGVFKLASQRGIDCKKFVKDVMTSSKLNRLFIMDDCQEWCDSYYLYHEIENRIPLVKGDTEDDYLMWFTGYLYKYWMSTRNLDRRQVYKILPFDKMIRAFDFYHTQDWEYVVEEATRVYNERLEKRKNKATKSTT